MVDLMQETYAPSEAARVLGLSLPMVEKYRRAGRLRFIATPVGRLLLRDDVHRLKAEREAQRQRVA